MHIIIVFYLYVFSNLTSRLPSTLDNVSEAYDIFSYFIQSIFPIAGERIGIHGGDCARRCNIKLSYGTYPQQTYDLFGLTKSESVENLAFLKF